MQDTIEIPRRLLNDCATWLGKMIADEGHKRAAMPLHCELTLLKVERALYGRPDPNIAIIKRMMSFVSGFEDDEMQEGVAEMLTDARAAIANAEDCANG